jgi:hypothetical protein
VSVGDRSPEQLVHDGDPDELVRAVDRWCARQDWEAVLGLRDRCLAAAHELGRQLWGPAQYAEYRLALEAPAPLACAVVRPGAARFALGPLTEVLAQDHPWAEMAPHLDPPVVAATVAQERVLRGDDLTGDDRAHPHELELPLVLQPWEPTYALPTYRAAELVEGGPPPPSGWQVVPDPRPGRPHDAGGLAAALRDVVAPWEEQSTGEVHVVAVAGSAAAAVAALLPGTVRVAPLTVAQAFDHLAWAGASGGARGRRRGLAAGRAAAWWVAHRAAGLAFPADPGALGRALERLAWYAFDDGTPGSGWQLRLAVEDPRSGGAAAVDAHDRPDP